jgi:hypothetical protein
MTVSVKADPPAEVLGVLYQSITGQPISPAGVQHMQVEDTLKGIAKASVASDHADNLMSSKSVDDEPETPMSKGVGNANPTSR